MTPIGRPHNPGARSGTGQWRLPPEQAGGAQTDRPDPASAAEAEAEAEAEGAAPVDTSAPPAPAPAEESAPAGEAPAADAAGAAAGEPAPEPVGDAAAELATVRAERDDYLELARAKQAELENFRKQVLKRQADQLQQAAADLVTKLLPVLDALDNGVGHGDESLVPVRGQLLGLLEKEGLRRVDPAGAPFDPNEHDAVAHEEGDGAEATVAETLRAGYWWNGRLLRPAMVRVRG
jgi:molecular chaperone GrpE